MISTEVQRDLSYGQANGETLRLDVYAPRAGGPHPVALVLHGGGWSGGDKTGDTAFLCADLSTAGFVVVTPNYRLAPAHRWPACLEDVQAALEWTRRNAARWNGKTDALALVGYSAGGHLAALAAMKSAAGSVGAVALLAAPTDLVADTRRRGELSPSLQALLGADEVSPAVEAQLARMSPLGLVRAGLPPFGLWHGDADLSVPLSQSLMLCDRLRANNVRCDLEVLPDTPHRLSDWPPLALQIAVWLRRMLA